MKTNYPEVFAIELDRDEVAREFAQLYRVSSWMLLGAVGFLVWLAVFTKSLEFLSYNPNSVVPNGVLVVGFFILTTVLVVAGVWLLSELIYRTIGKRMGAKRAARFSVDVEGAFLRIIDGRSDRKIHFRQIGDYEAVSSKRKNKPTVGTVRMRIVSGGANTSFLSLYGVKELIATRDLLAEVDAERE
ncbi:hypothetical protein AAFN60_17050 [Roseibacillus persicicus]|uniref:hypothetical protein n=1 Tax=Roseibacillus persicicus TaxID=454148 RepID=UPI00398A7190